MCVGICWSFLRTLRSNKRCTAWTFHRWSFYWTALPFLLPLLFIVTFEERSLISVFGLLNPLLCIWLPYCGTTFFPCQKQRNCKNLSTHALLLVVPWVVNLLVKLNVVGALVLGMGDFQRYFRKGSSRYTCTFCTDITLWIKVTFVVKGNLFNYVSHYVGVILLVYSCCMILIFNQKSNIARHESNRMKSNKHEPNWKECCFSSTK